MSGIVHSFVALDYMNRKLHFVDEANPAKSWSVPSEGVLQDLQLVGGGLVAVTRPNGWAFHSLADGKVEKVVVAEGVVGNLSAFRFLPEGGVVAGVNGPRGTEILELSNDGKLLKKHDFAYLKELRQLHRTPEGTWLMTHYSGGVELSLQEDKVLRSFAIPNLRYAYMLLKKPNGNCLLSGGYSKTVCEVTKDDKLVASFSGPQPEGMENYFYSGSQLLKNGHLVQANWNGHNDSDYKLGIKLFEFDESGKAVWTWNTSKEHVGSITAFAILDDLDVSKLNDDVFGVLKAV